jgi:ATP-dependent RNA helicase RhlB
MEFSKYDLDERILKGIEKAGFTATTPVQAETLKHSLKGKDVLVQSQTGTGKTAAFLISLFQLMLTREDLKGKKALILAPTRELALQIEKEARLLGQFLDLKIGCFYGGVGYNQQDRLLKEGVDIMIGTPGRLMDYGNSGKILFRDFGFLIIDEADRMFDMGFLPDLRRIMKKMIPAGERISMLFSATLSHRVKNLAWEYTNEPAEVNMSPEQVTVDKIKQIIYHVNTSEKINLLLGILKTHNPENALIFTNTKQNAIAVAARLSGNGYICDYIIGDLPQGRRTKIIESIKSGKLKYLVATDVAARGLHINDLDMVINYDIPEDFENYVHRIGRTARAGKSGMAITLACEKFVYGLDAIEQYIRMKIPVDWVTDELLVADNSSPEHINKFLKNAKGLRVETGERKKPGKSTKTEKTERKTAVSKTARVKTSIDESKNRKKPAAAASSIKAGKSTQAGKTPYKKSAVKNEKKMPVKARQQVPGKSNPTMDKLPQKASLSDRMKYYSEKYGEDFTVSREIKPEKKSAVEKITGRIKSLFGKK